LIDCYIKHDAVVDNYLLVVYNTRSVQAYQPLIFSTIRNQRSLL